MKLLKKQGDEAYSFIALYKVDRVYIILAKNFVKGIVHLSEYKEKSTAEWCYRDLQNQLEGK